jgi:2-haloacid dehalogenase
MKPALFTFDIFGTVVDWRYGLEQSLARRGRSLSVADFDRVMDAQGRDEQAQFLPYREITARSLVSELEMGRVEAEEIGIELGAWPPFADAAPGLTALLKLAPCVAMTNSDLAHRGGVQSSLGLQLSDWVCAEEIRVYKPSPRFWQVVSERLKVPLGRHWWHVSAYADYDLDVAASLGLSTVFVTRPHRRPGPAHVTVSNLLELAELVRAAG